MSKYFRTTIVIEVLSEDTQVDEISISEIAHRIANGEFSGEIKAARVEELTPAQMVIALTEQGNDSGFFHVD
jgi:hypothetical protein